MDTLVHAGQGLLESIRASVSYVHSLGPSEFVAVFWALVFLEIPRYLISDVIVLVRFLVRGRDGTPGAPANGPLVSVILPALNEEKTIEHTIRSVLEQDWPHIEVIVIDDGSTDRTPEICEDLEKKRVIRFVRFEEREGKSAALNCGLRLARGAYVVFMDTDSTLGRGVITRMMAHFADERIGAVSGDLAPRNPRVNLLTRMQALEYMTALSIGRRFRALAGILCIVPGASGAFRRELVDRVGGHEPGPGNDSDLTIRIRKLGYQIAFAADADCLTDVPTSWRSWGRQRMRWDRNLIRNRVRKHTDTYRVGNAHFRILNLLSFLDTVVFSVVLSLAWLVYVADVAIRRPQWAGTILAANFFFHFLLKSCQFAIAAVVTERGRQSLDLALWLPLFGVYRIITRFVRLAAITQEVLFRWSYKDPFAPEKVRKQVTVY